MFARIRELERENAKLKQELAYVTGERDEAVNKAVELCHINTYIAEVGNRKGLVSVKCVTD